MKAICNSSAVRILKHRPLAQDRGQRAEQGSQLELLRYEALHYSRLHRLQMA